VFYALRFLLGVERQTAPEERRNDHALQDDRSLQEPPPSVGYPL